MGMKVLKKAHAVVTCKCNAQLEVERGDIIAGSAIGGRLTAIPSVTCPECGRSVAVPVAAGWGMGMVL